MRTGTSPRGLLAERRRSCAWSRDFLTAPFAAPLVARERLDGLDRFPTVEDLNERLGAPVRFVRAPERREKDPTRLYEYRAAVDGEVLTRPHNWHDLYPALSWASFPASKIALTRLLVEAQQRWLAEERLRDDVERGRLPGARRRVQDLLAMFDEGGVVLAGEETIWFGHALFEHRWLVPAQRLRGSVLKLASRAPELDRAIAAAVGAPEFLSGRQPTLEV